MRPPRQGPLIAYMLAIAATGYMAARHHRDLTPIATHLWDAASGAARVVSKELLIGPAEAGDRGRNQRTEDVKLPGNSSSFQNSRRRTSSGQISTRQIILSKPPLPVRNTTNSATNTPQGGSNSGSGSSGKTVTKPDTTPKIPTADRSNGQKNSNNGAKGVAQEKTAKPGNSPVDNNDDDIKRDDNGAPATVADMFKAAAKPGKAKRAAAPAGDILKFRDLGPRRRNDDVLVTNLNSAAKARLEAKGFKAKEVQSIGNSKKTVTRLVPPKGLDGQKAHEVIKLETPNVGAFDDYVYKIVPPFPNAPSLAPQDGLIPDAAKNTERNERDIEAPVGERAGQCREDRCFARQVIKWNSDLSSCSRRVKIGVIDTPVDLNHPVFAGQRIKVGSFVKDAHRSQSEWHGTAVMSILSGRFDSGVPGLAPEAEYYVAEAFQTDTEGESSSSTMGLLRALGWLDTWGVSIVNMSFSGPRDPLVEDMIANMQAKGVHFVAAAGNFGPTAPASYPAAYKDVIAVTAVSKDLNNYVNANRGNYVDLAAPGVKIWTALPGGKEGYRTGTSFAAPFVTGILAASLSGSSTKPMSKETLLSRLPVEDLGPPGPDPIFGRGLAMAPSSCGAARYQIAQPAAKKQAPKDDGEPEFSFGTLTVIPEIPSFSAGSPPSALGFSQ